MALGLDYIADVALAAGSLGVLRLVYRRFAGADILFPLAVLFGSGCAVGIMRALINVAIDLNEPELAQGFVRAALVAGVFFVPAFVHVVTLYPRQIHHPVAKVATVTLYVLAIAYALLVPTRIIVQGFDTTNNIPVVTLAPYELVLSAPTYTVMGLAVAWMAYLAVRAESFSEKRDARALLLASLPPTFFFFFLPILGYPAHNSNYPSPLIIAFGWGILFAGLAIYRGWFRPPVPQGLQTILDASTDAILILDEHGRVSTANLAARDLGSREGVRLEGLMLADALPHELREKESSDLLTMSAMGVLRGRIDRNTHEFHSRDVSSRSFIVSVLPVGVTGAGPARGALVLLREETSRIALEDATRQMARLQDLVIRVLGHDVKTPLAVIQGYAELARSQVSGPVDEKGSAVLRNYLERILEAVTSSHLILSNARAISRLAPVSGTVVELGDVDVSRMAQQAASVMQPLAKAKGLTLRADVDPSVRVRAPKGFDSVFMNLISNAIKYTPPGGEVVLTLSVKDKRVVVRVSDTGPGIEPENREHLFARFERLDADKGGIEGQGLGLSIVSSFVDLVGGQVRVEDRPDGRSGAVFVVEMLANGEQPAPAAKDTATSSSPIDS